MTLFAVFHDKESCHLNHHFRDNFQPRRALDKWSIVKTSWINRLFPFFEAVKIDSGGLPSQCHGSNRLDAEIAVLTQSVSERFQQQQWLAKRITLGLDSRCCIDNITVEGDVSLENTHFGNRDPTHMQTGFKFGNHPIRFEIYSTSVKIAFFSATVPWHALSSHLAKSAVSGHAQYSHSHGGLMSDENENKSQRNWPQLAPFPSAKSGPLHRRHIGKSPPGAG